MTLFPKYLELLILLTGLSIFYGNLTQLGAKSIRGELLLSVRKSKRAKLRLAIKTVSFAFIFTLSSIVLYHNHQNTTRNFLVMTLGTVSYAIVVYSLFAYKPLKLCENGIVDIQSFEDWRNLQWADEKSDEITLRIK